MGKNDLKRKLNRGINQLSDNIELKKINMEELQPLSETELDDLLKNHEKRMKTGYGSYRMLAAVVSLIVVITGFLIYFRTASTYSKVEIVGIPALTIYMKDSRVVKIKAMNRESESLIEGIETDQPLSAVLDNLFLKMDENGCFDEENNLEISIQGRDKEELERQVSVKAESLIEKNSSASVSVNHKKLLTHDQQEVASVNPDAENAGASTESDDNSTVDIETTDETSDAADQKEKGSEDFINNKTDVETQDSVTGSEDKNAMEGGEGSDLSTEAPQEDTSQAGEEELDTDSSKDDSENQSSKKKKKKKKRKKKRKSRKKKNKKKKTTRNKKKEIIINNVTNENETDGMNKTEPDSLSNDNSAAENNVEN